MNPDQRTKLNQYIDENGTKDFTESIRESKRSVQVRADALQMLEIKQMNPDMRFADPETFDRICAHECEFLYKEMNFLYEKLRDDKVDMVVFWKFLAMLERVERGELDQHTASMHIGEMLKRMYIDKVISGGDDNVGSGVNSDISWSEYKKKKMD
jgi:hypothetical protein